MDPSSLTTTPTDIATTGRQLWVAVPRPSGEDGQVRIASRVTFIYIHMMEFSFIFYLSDILYVTQLSHQPPH